MRYGIFADVHSNLEALSVVLDAYAKENIDRFLCIGDVVGYAAKPNECIKKIKEINAAVVAGNHDWAVIDKRDISYFNPVAKHAALWTMSILTEESRNFLDSLDLTFEQDDYTLVHGTLNQPEEFYYMIDFVNAQDTFELLKKDVCFIGHSHVPGIFAQKDGAIDLSKEQQTALVKERKYIVNVGSVGQPRDGDPRASYCIYDSTNREVTIKRVEYNVEKTQEQITQAGLPAFLAHRLTKGI
ncbi:metallophosphoesterase family protein [Candidatus Omnitrophota bacterium]